MLCSRSTATVQPWILATIAFGVPQSLASDADQSAACSRGMPGRDNLLLQTDRTANIHKDGMPDLPPAWTANSELIWLEDSDAGLVQGFSAVLQNAPTNEELEHFNLVRAERERGWTCPDGTQFPPNRGEFTWDCRLWRAARKWSQRMASEDFFSHSAQGSNPCTRTEAEGFPKFAGCGENIAAGNSAAQATVDQLKAS